MMIYVNKECLIKKYILYDEVKPTMVNNFVSSLLRMFKHFHVFHASYGHTVLKIQNKKKPNDLSLICNENYDKYISIHTFSNDE